MIKGKVIAYIPNLPKRIFYLNINPIEIRKIIKELKAKYKINPEKLTENKINYLKEIIILYNKKIKGVEISEKDFDLLNYFAKIHCS